MNANPFEPSRDTTSSITPESRSEPAGFGPRFAAYLIDILPISIALAVIYYFLLGFDETWLHYTTSPDDAEARAAFLSQRNQMRDLSFLVYVLYCGVMECSAWQATLGKKLMGIRVTDNQGQPLSVGRSFGRNFAKFLSYIPLGLGFLWMIWSKQKRGWHDMLAKTLVMK
ncbi:RDD family protein [Allorhodopirellula solitaria]|nr:RDD family protein [Allorhodopirellula solitaria]